MNENTQNPSQGSQFDPSVVALMHGLKSAEGTNGNYDSIGDQGTASGIGQWSNDVNGKPQKLNDGQIPANFSSMAQQYGLNPTDFSPENQNKVLYTALSAEKQQGLTPEQILSKWNSGNPNAYENPSTSTGNGPVGNYNVSAYVKKGMTAAQQYAQMNNSPSGPPASESQSQDTQSTNSSFSPMDIGLGLVGMAGSALPTLWQYAQKPLVDAGVDAGIGAVTGSEVAPGEGTLAGAGVGAASGVVQGILQDLFGGSNTSSSPSSGSSSDTSNSSNTPAPPPTSDLPSEAQTLINEATQSELNQRIGGRNLSQSPEGKLGTATMAENGYIPQNNNGNADYSSAMAISQNNTSQAANIEKQAASGSIVPMSEVLANAQRNINNSNVAPDIKQKTLSALEDISSSYGTGDISGEDAITARHQQYAAVKKDWSKMGSAEIEARKALGTAFRDTALDHSNNKDLQRAAIFEQQKQISAQKVMKKIHNHPLSKKYLHPMRKELYKLAATWAETYVGEKIGGTVGAILGYAIGSHINSRLEKQLKKTNFDTPEMKKAIEVLRDTKPAAYNHFKQILQSNNINVPKVPKEPSSGEDKEKQVEKNIPQKIKEEMNTRIPGEARGFPAKEDKKPISPALQALMQSGVVPTRGLVDLKTPLPPSKRKGQFSNVR
jgi:hypothetical protein